jgi:hypothetical protein
MSEGVTRCGGDKVAFDLFSLSSRLSALDSWSVRSLMVDRSAKPRRGGPIISLKTVTCRGGSKLRNMLELDVRMGDWRGCLAS